MMSVHAGLTVPFVVGAAALGITLGVPLAIAAGRLLRVPRALGWKVGVAASVAAAALFALVAATVSAPLELAAYLVLAASAIMLAIVDLVDKRLPNVVVLPAAAVLIVLLLLSSLVRGSWEVAVGVLAGALALFALYLVLALISPRGMGMGDVKLAVALGAAAGYLGLTTWLVGLVAGFFIGAAASLSRSRAAQGRAAEPRAVRPLDARRHIPRDSTHVNELRVSPLCEFSSSAVP